MNYDQIRYLVELYRTTSVTKAAENLYVSQSTISKSLSKLQRTLGTELFHATKTGVEFTDVGFRVVNRAKIFLAELDQFTIDVEDIIRNDLSTLKGEISITATPLSQDLVLPYIIPPFMKICPGVQIQMKTDMFEDILAAVARRNADVAFLPLSDKQIENIDLQKKIKVYPLCKYSFVAVMRNNHPLCEQPQISLSDIPRYPLISMSSNLDDYTMLCHLIGYSTDRQPQIAMRTENPALAFEIARTTDCLAISSNFVRVHLFSVNREICVSTIKGGSQLTYCGIYRSESEKQDLIEVLLRHVNLN